MTDSESASTLLKLLIERIQKMSQRIAELESKIKKLESKKNPSSQPEPSLIFND